MSEKWGYAQRIEMSLRIGIAIEPELRPAPAPVPCGIAVFGGLTSRSG